MLRNTSNPASLLLQGTCLFLIAIAVEGSSPAIDQPWSLSSVAKRRSKRAVIQDVQGCCCSLGVPVECLSQCQLTFPIEPDTRPEYCATYQVATRYCFGITRHRPISECDRPTARTHTCAPRPLFSISSDFCTSNRQSCHSDFSCFDKNLPIEQQTFKCCPTSCSADGLNSGAQRCWPSVSRRLTQCERHRERVLDRLVISNVVAPDESEFTAWMPKCVNYTAVPQDFDDAIFPSYLERQCIQAANTCFCVDTVSGEEILHTRYSSMNFSANDAPTCTEFGNATACEKETLVIVHEHSHIGSREEVEEAARQGLLYLPSCSADLLPGQRSHIHLQCHPVEGTCWCTLDDGRVILDTIRSESQSVELNMCTAYQPTPCDVRVASVLYGIRQGLRVNGQFLNASQFIGTRLFYELAYREPFIPRCVPRNSTASFRELQLTRPFEPRFSEMFCVNPTTGEELPDSRLGPGEHRFLGSRDKRCPFRRTLCQRQVYEILSKLRNGTDTVNREMASEFVPSCVAPSAASDSYGFVARQCSARNASCWCVFIDGQIVEGTTHRNTTSTNCQQYRKLCLLPGRIVRVTQAYTLNHIVPQCPASQQCIDVTAFRGIGVCIDVSSRNCVVTEGREVRHGAVYINRDTCEMCRCYDGRLNQSCRAIAGCHQGNTGTTPTPATDCRSMIAAGASVAATSASSSRVCTPTGVEYSTIHVALVCSEYEMSQILPTPCADVNPCSSSPCGSYQRCIVLLRQCFTLPCPQYMCVQQNITCTSPALSNTTSFCGRDNVTYSSLCRIHLAGTSLRCIGECRNDTTPVCGTNGRTYSSACEAEAELMSVDYNGTCSSCRQGSSPMGICRSTSHCKHTSLLPSSCCRFCGAGGIIRVNTMMSSSLATAGGVPAANDVIAIIEALAQRLSSVVRTRCRLRGHLNGNQELEVQLSSAVVDEASDSSEICRDGMMRLSESINKDASASNAAAQTAALNFSQVVVTTNGSTEPTISTVVMTTSCGIIRPQLLVVAFVLLMSMITLTEF